MVFCRFILVTQSGGRLLCIGKTHFHAQPLEVCLCRPPQNVLQDCNSIPRYFVRVTADFSTIPSCFSFFSPSQFLSFISHFLRKHGSIVAQRVPLPQPDPIEVADRNANFRRRFEEPKGLSFPLITLFPANWKASPLPRSVARAV